jgi:hypothetical protein
MRDRRFTRWYDEHSATGDAGLAALLLAFVLPTGGSARTARWLLLVEGAGTIGLTAVACTMVLT